MLIEKLLASGDEKHGLNALKSNVFTGDQIKSAWMYNNQHSHGTQQTAPALHCDPLSQKLGKQVGDG